MMRYNQKLIAGVLALTLFLLFKAWYTIASVASLFFLLYPSAKAVEIFTNTAMHWSIQRGFVFSEMGVVIDKSCSGFNWWMLAFLISFFTGLTYLKSSKPFFWLLPVLLIVTYFLTIVVNTTRICLALIIEPLLAQYASSIHLIGGIFVYLSYLLLWQLTCKFYFKNLNLSYENLAKS